MRWKKTFCKVFYTSHAVVVVAVVVVIAVVVAVVASAVFSPEKFQSISFQ